MKWLVDPLCRPMEDSTSVGRPPRLLLCFRAGSSWGWTDYGHYFWLVSLCFRRCWLVRIFRGPRQKGFRASCRSSSFNFMGRNGRCYLIPCPPSWYPGLEQAMMLSCILLNYFIFGGGLFLHIDRANEVYRWLVYSSSSSSIITSAWLTSTAQRSFIFDFLKLKFHSKCCSSHSQC